MKVILKENKFIPLMLNEMVNEYNISDGNANHNPYSKQIKSATNTLDKLLQTSGQIMGNVTNGRPYLVYEIISLANIVGKRYGICKLIKDGETYGSIMIKPMVNFKYLQ